MIIALDLFDRVESCVVAAHKILYDLFLIVVAAVRRKRTRIFCALLERALDCSP